MTNALSSVAQDFVNRNLFAGVQWRVDQAGEPKFQGRSGVQDLATQTAIPEDAIYRIYSMTKPIVSVLAVMLIERGVFNLSSKIADFDPRFSAMRVLYPDGQFVPAQTLITIEHLLTHRAGFSYDFALGCGIAPYYRDIGFLAQGARDLGDVMGDLASVPLLYHPGQNWRYSIATDFLAHIIECATGQRMDALLADLLFDPLGMHDTGFSLAQEKQSRLMGIYGANQLQALPPLVPHEHVLTPANLGESHPLDDPNFRRGGHGLTSTTDDYMAFANMLLTGCSRNGDRLLSPAMLALLQSPRVTFGPRGMRINDEPFAGYSWNLMGRVMVDLGQADRLTSIGEFGWSGAAATYFWVDPAKQLTGVIMTQFLGSQHPIAAKMQTAAYSTL